jgi:hypothetical protein
MHAVIDLKDYKQILPAASIQNLSPPPRPSQPFGFIFGNHQQYINGGVEALNCGVEILNYGARKASVSQEGTSQPRISKP